MYAAAPTCGKLCRRMTGSGADNPNMNRIFSFNARLAACLLSFSLAAVASAQTVSDSPPIHAEVSRYGGWDCLPGYDRKAQTCIPIKVPPNAYLDASHNQWECDRGYAKVQKACVAVKVPVNAYAENYPFSSGWRCNRGYRQDGPGCTRIVVPQNAYSLELASGRGWECNRGFRLAGETCASVKIPSNGFLGRYGDDWQCE